MMRLDKRRVLAAAAIAVVVQTPVAGQAKDRQAQVVKVERAKPGDMTRPTVVGAIPVKPVRKAGQLFAVVMGPGPAWKKGQPLKKGGSDGHWRYWQALYDRGLVDSAGPVGQDTGFVLLRARNQQEANAVVAGDPAVKAGRFRAVARPYDETIGD